MNKAMMIRNTVFSQMVKDVPISAPFTVVACIQGQWQSIPDTQVCPFPIHKNESVIMSTCATAEHQLRQNALQAAVAYRQLTGNAVLVVRRGNKIIERKQCVGYKKELFWWGV